MDQPIRSRVASEEYRKNWELSFKPGFLARIWAVIVAVFHG